MNADDRPPIIPPQSTVIRFHFSLADLIKCRLWVQHHNKILMGFMVIASLLFPLTDWNAPQIKDHPLTTRIFVFVFTAIIIFLFMSAVNVLFLIIYTAFNKNKDLVGTHEIELGQDCLTEKTADSASTFRWSAYHKTRSSRKYLFLYVNQNNVLYIPKDRFSSRQLMEQFLAEVWNKSGKR